MKISFNELRKKNEEIFQKELKSHSDVSEYYKILENCIKTEDGNKLFEMIKEIEMKIESKKKEGFFTKMTNLISDLHNVEHGIKIGAEKRFTDLFADLIIAYSKVKIIS